jgi:hypothetical protein
VSLFVAGELSKRGWIATLTAQTTLDCDVLAARPTDDTHVQIDVKNAGEQSVDFRRKPVAPISSSGCYYRTIHP